MWCPAGWVITHHLVHSVQLQPLLQSSSEVAGRGKRVSGFGDGVGLVSYRVRSLVVLS